MVQTTIFKNAYRTFRLDEVSRAILADRRHDGVGSEVLEKYKGLTGKEIQSFPVPTELITQPTMPLPRLSKLD